MSSEEECLFVVNTAKDFNSRFKTAATKTVSVKNLDLTLYEESETTIISANIECKIFSDQQSEWSCVSKFGIKVKDRNLELWRLLCSFPSHRLSLSSFERIWYYSMCNKSMMMDMIADSLFYKHFCNLPNLTDYFYYDLFFKARKATMDKIDDLSSSNSLNFKEMILFCNELSISILKMVFEQNPKPTGGHYPECLRMNICMCVNEQRNALQAARRADDAMCVEWLEKMI